MRRPPARRARAVLAAGLAVVATAAGLILRPLTGPVPAGQASAYRFQITQAGGSPLTRYQTGQTRLLHF